MENYYCCHRLEIKEGKEMSFSFRFLVIAVLFCLCSGLALSGNSQTASNPEIAAPLVIADFDKPGDIALWSGVTCERADALTSGGKNAMAMQFALTQIPSFIKRQEASLAWNNGKGYATRDWSPYGSLAFDVRIESSKPEILTLFLKAPKGELIWSTTFLIEPGVVKSLEVLLEGLESVIDLGKVEELSFLSPNPPRTFKVTVDNLKLLPRKKPLVATFNLLYPNYRGLVFPEEDTVEIRASIQAEAHGLVPDNLELEMKVKSGQWQVSRRLPISAKRFTLPVKNMLFGHGTLSAALISKPDSQELALSVWKLRRLSPDEAATLPVYIDRNNNTIMNGKPFFPLGWYAGHIEQQMNEIADSPFNCILDYGTNRMSKEWMLRYMDNMHQKGLKLIYCMNDVYPTATYLEKSSWEGVKGNDAIADAVVKAYRNHPAILAWYLNDELPPELVPKLTDYYERVKSNDPGHPCLIVLCQPQDFRHFPDTTDIMGFDNYPVPGALESVPNCVDMAIEASGGREPVWAVLQAFAWYQYRSSNKDRGHQPTKEELESGRAPTFEEERCMTWLALAHGSKGIIYYCYYDLRVLPQYQEMWAWMKKIGQEVKDFTPVLLSSNDLGPVCFIPDDLPIHTKLKEHEGNLYLIAVNSGKSECELSFDFGESLEPDVELVFEEGTAKARGALLPARFKPLQARIFRLRKSD